MYDWYQIENGSFTVQITTFGAEVKRMFAKPWHRDLLWVPQDDQEKKLWNRSSPIVFPEKEKFLDKNFECERCDATEIHLLYRADKKSLEQYPFAFDFRVKYTLLDRLLFITYEVTNTDQVEIDFSLGAFIAFQTTKISDYEIHCLEKNIIKLNKEFFLKNEFLFKNIKSKHVDLIDLGRHEVIRINGTNTPCFSIWGKDTIPFVCLGPSYGMENDRFGDLVTKQVLAKDKTFVFSYSIELMMSEG